ncbi:MAG TPA: FAD-linked oxidase C-terminal domain-containing protein [Armatimonadota bacterium]|jgi:D-lactate dehydrogenase (cytochrome)
MPKSACPASLPAPVLEDFRQALGSARLLCDPLSRRVYQYDAALDQQLPAAVALPESTDQVQALVQACVRHRVPFTPRGAGTSLSGGPIPTPGALLISLARLNRVLDIRPLDLCAVVQPGVVNLELQRQLAPLGLSYAPDPSSQLVSTIGGNLGHNAGGPHCLKYGVTAHHILEIEVITPQGERVRLGGRGAAAPGCNLLGLWVGSEGTLGLVTEITCHLTPLPEATLTALVAFDSLEAASSTVSAIIARGIIPAALEMMDRPLLEAVERGLQAGYPVDAEAVLLIDVDGPRAALAGQLAAIREICGQFGAREFRQAETESERTLLWRGRKGTAAALANLAPGKISTDISVPRQHLPEMLARISETAARQHLSIGNLLHAGDGNLHPQMIFDPRDADQLARVMAAQDEVIRAALSLGGAMTGEHGVGTEKRKFMPLMFGPAELALMRDLKVAFDPENLANPGKLLPDDIPPTAPAAPLPEGSFSRVADTLAVSDEPGRLKPYDYEALAKLLALAARENQPVCLRGAETVASRAAGPVLSSRGLHHIVAVETANLTVTAQAGVTLADLQTALAAQGHWWPVLPPGGDQATVGGVLAAGLGGPFGVRYGRLADLLTGVRLALTSGEVVRFGVSCVKNVAGYALERLVVGSRGTLAALLEATLRTVPLPPARATQLFRADTLAPLERLAQAALLGSVRPAALELLSPAAAVSLGLPDPDAPRGGLLLVAWHGAEPEIAAGQAALAAGSAWIEDVPLDPAQTPSLWARVADLSRPGDWPELLEILCPPSDTAGAFAAAQAAAASHGVEAVLSASPGLGSVRVGLPELTPDQRPLREVLRTVAATHGGWLRSLSADGASLTPLPEALRDLNHRLKTVFDPRGILPAGPETTHE